ASTSSSPSSTLTSASSGRSDAGLPIWYGPAMAQARHPLIDDTTDRQFFTFNAVVSALALACIAYILLVRRGGAAGAVDLGFLPAVNATLNGLASVLLVAGWVAIKRRAMRVHKRLMVAAFAASTLFLISYLTYHYVHGDTRYQGAGPL